LGKDRKKKKEPGQAIFLQICDLLKAV